MISEISQAAIAQAPMLNTYVEATYARWQASHGPEIGRAALDAAKDMHPAELPLLPAFVGLQLLELSPANETWITNAGARHFAESGGQDIWGSAWEVAQRTTALEIPLAFLATWAVYKMRPAAKAIYENYLASPEPLTETEKSLLSSANDTETEKKPSALAIAFDSIKAVASKGVEKIKESRTAQGIKSSRIAKAAGKTAVNYGLALSTGTGGVVISKDLAEGGETPVRKNLVRGGLAAMGIIGFNYGLGAGFTASIKHDLPVLKDICQFTIDWLKTPVLAAIAFTALGLSSSTGKKKILMARHEAREIAAA